MFCFLILFIVTKCYNIWKNYRPIFCLPQSTDEDINWKTLYDKLMYSM